MGEVGGSRRGVGESRGECEVRSVWSVWVFWEFDLLTIVKNMLEWIEII